MSAADELLDFYVHTAAVETYTGDLGRGPTYATAVYVACFLSDVTKLVRNTTGEQVVSSSELTGPPALAALFPPKSRVTVNGRTTEVITSERHTSGVLDLPDHTSVSLA